MNADLPAPSCAPANRSLPPVLSSGESPILGHQQTAAGARCVSWQSASPWRATRVQTIEEMEYHFSGTVCRDQIHIKKPAAAITRSALTAGMAARCNHSHRRRKRPPPCQETSWGRTTTAPSVLRMARMITPGAPPSIPTVRQPGEWRLCGDWATAYSSGL